MPPEKNKLYYGDNLKVLRQYVPDASVDLIYLDPPFNSRQDYNVLFAERDGSRSASQITALKDTWEWNLEAERSYEEVVERGGRVSDAIRSEELKNENAMIRDYKLSPQDTARIQCTALDFATRYSSRCNNQAIYSQNRGSAPFWYHCEAHAAIWRAKGKIYCSAGDKRALSNS